MDYPGAGSEGDWVMVDLQLGSSCKTPEHGDVFIDERDRWSSTGYFRVVFRHPKSDILVTMPLVFMSELDIVKSLTRVSTQAPPESIMPIAKVKLI